jgi:hypothetical protein
VDKQGVKRWAAARPIKGKPVGCWYSAVPSSSRAARLAGVLVSPLGGPHSIRGVGKSVAGVALNRVAKCRPFPLERGCRGTGRLIIEAGPVPRLHFWPAIPGPALAPPKLVIRWATPGVHRRR